MMTGLLLALIATAHSPATPPTPKPATLVRGDSSYTGYLRSGKFYDCEGHAIKMKSGDRFIPAIGSCGDAQLRLHSGHAPHTPNVRPTSRP